MQGSTPVECEVLNVIQGAGIWPDCDDKTQLLQAIEALISGGGSGGGGVVAGSEIGSVSAFAMPTPPTGWLVCDGSAVSRTDYADLFAAIGTVWGDGDQISTFNLPDLRGEFLRGLDAGRGVDEGRAFASSQLDEFKAHSHGIETWGVNTGMAGQVHMGNGSPFQNVPTSETGGTETRPRNVAMTYAIKAFYPTSA